MSSLFDEFHERLLEPQEGPCLSLYMPTHRRHPENQQDVIRFRNGIRELEESLKREYPNREIAPLLEPFRELAERHDFWNHALDGLAALGAPGFFRAYRLQRSVPERTVVADSFHTKPLLRIVQSADRYRVLGLSRGEVRMFEGNRDALDEVDLFPGMPATPADLLGDERDNERATRHYGKAASGSMVNYGNTGSRSGKITRHGTDVRQDALDRETEQFFRAIDRAVLEHASHGEPMPLLLAALPENHGLFRRLSRNPSLASAALYANPDSMSLDELRQRAWDLVQPYYLERLTGLVGAFEAARAHQLGADDLSDIGAAIAAGRVYTLLVEADRVVPGRFDVETGAVSFAELSDPAVDDLLDDLAEEVLRTGGEVVVVPADRMPTRTGAAATYRF